MTGTQLLKKVSATLNKVKACDKDVYLKVVTTSGGNPAIRVPGTTSVAITKITPRPAMSYVTLEDIQGSSGVLMLGDVKFILPGSVDADTLQKSVVLYGTVNYKIVDIGPVIFDNTVVGYEVVCRRMGE